MGDDISFSYISDRMNKMLSFEMYGAFGIIDDNWVFEIYELIVSQYI